MSSHSKSVHGLEASGLPDREARLWQALATHGLSNVSQLARLTKLHRPAIYQLLPTLIKKGLVKENTQNRRVSFSTTGSKAFETWCASRNQALVSYLEQRNAKEGVSLVGEDVAVYHGKDIRRIWEAVVNESPKNTIFYRYDGYAPGTNVTTYLPKGYYDAVERKKLERFVITNQGLRKASYRKRIECASRMLPTSADRFEQGVSQFIFGDKIAFVDFTTETAFLIKNKAIAAYHTKLFQFVYKTLVE